MTVTQVNAKAKRLQQLNKLNRPSYIIDEVQLIENLTRCQSLQSRYPIQVLLAMKAFSSQTYMPLIKQYLSGVSVSSYNEARLAHESGAHPIHCYSPAFEQGQFQALLEMVSSITFNSVGQWAHYKAQVNQYPAHISCGLRINPEHEEVKNPLYNPCGPRSRFGVTINQVQKSDFKDLDGILCHNLCGHSSHELERTIMSIETKFGEYLSQLKWINLGGGHMLTRDDYNRTHLGQLADYLSDKYELDVYIEPGEAIVYEAGYLVCQVLDIIDNGGLIAIVNVSASAHMPDVIEMPYRPHILGSKSAGKTPYTYQIGGNTCLSGDIMGEYAFESPLQIGQPLIFTDMAQYTMVKNTTFNGVSLPDIAQLDSHGNISPIQAFGYESFVSRLP